MLVRREQPGDQAGVHAVHTAAFGKGDAVPGEATLVDLLRAGDGWIEELSFVAVYGGGVAGHVVCSRATVAGRPVLALGPSGVLRRGKDRRDHTTHACESFALEPAGVWAAVTSFGSLVL